MSINRKRKELNLDDTMRNPIRAIDSIALRIRQKNIGYQAALRRYVAHLYSAGSKIAESYELYQELISHEFSHGRKRLVDATEENFPQYAYEGTVRRAFHNSGVSESCVSKYNTLVEYLAEQGVPSEKAEATIRSLGGVEKAYGVAKESKKGLAAAKPKSSSEGQSATKSSKMFISDFLQVTLEKKALKNYLKASEGEERLVLLRCAGRDETGYLVWALIEDEKGNSRRPSNDDDDYGDIEDVA